MLDYDVRKCTILEKYGSEREICRAVRGVIHANGGTRPLVAYGSRSLSVAKLKTITLQAM